MAKIPTQNDLVEFLAAMSNVFVLEPSTDILRDGSYVLSYPHLLSYFAPITSFKPEDVVRGAHMVYGWMPTVLDLHSHSFNEDIQAVADILTKAKNPGIISDLEIKKIAALINNSFVGASKLLHFVDPNQFAIWDSKIYSYVFKERPHNQRVNQVSKYRFYLKLLEELKNDVRFTNFQASINNKMGYDVSPLRALEVVMFRNAPVLKS